MGFKALRMVCYIVRFGVVGCLVEVGVFVRSISLAAKRRVRSGAQIRRSFWVEAREKAISDGL